MSRCAAIKADGGRCKGDAMGGAEWCYAHDPARAEIRRRNAKRGGKSGGKGRPRTETDALRKEIRDLIGGVLAGTVSQGPGAVALQGYNALLRILEHERRHAAPESGVLTYDELRRQMEQLVGLLHHRLPPEQFRALSDEIDAILDESSAG